MNYNIKGNGKPIILIHGWAMHSGIWDDLAELSREICSAKKAATPCVRGTFARGAKG